MIYGDYKFVLPRPMDITPGVWQDYRNKLTEMALWCSVQNWDGWGDIVEGDYEGFWFAYEENYIMFLLRWT